MKAYKMISLTSGLYRVLMRCMATRVQTWLSSQGKVPVHQFAFFKGRDCMIPWYVLLFAITWSKQHKLPLFLPLLTSKQPMTQWIEGHYGSPSLRWGYLGPWLFSWEVSMISTWVIYCGMATIILLFLLGLGSFKGVLLVLFCSIFSLLIHFPFF